MSSEIKMNKIFTEQPKELNAEETLMLDQVKSVRTTPRDARFPAQNQAGHCWNRYNEWILCLKETKNDKDQCSTLRQYAESICPSPWTDKWDEERDENTFPGIKYDG